MGPEGPAEKKNKHIAISEMIVAATENVNRAEIEMAIDDVEKSTAQKNHYCNIPKHIWIEVRGML